MSTLTTVSTSGLFKSMSRIMASGLVPMVRSSPGQGKSAIVKQLAAHFNLLLIDLRLSMCDPTTIMGFPQIINGRATYVPMSIFPLEDDPLPLIDPKDPAKGTYAGWLVFFDELPDAPPAIQSLAYKVILDKVVGDKPLHKKVLMAAAGNNAEDSDSAHDIATPLQSRVVHLDLVTSLEDFIANARSKKFDTRINAFLQYRPNLLDNFSPDHTGHTFACCRTWEMVSKQIKKIPDLTYDILPDLAGTIGEGVAQEFFAFSQIYRDLPTIADIQANPLMTKIPTEPSAQFAVSDMLYNHMSVTTAPTLLPYLDRLPIEFQVIVMRDYFNNNPADCGNPTFSAWLGKNALHLQP